MLIMLDIDHQTVIVNSLGTWVTGYGFSWTQSTKFYHSSILLTNQLSFSGEYGVSVNNVIPGIIYSDTAVQNYGPFGPKMFREARKQVSSLL